jgi:hypothetical protein
LVVIVLGVREHPLAVIMLCLHEKELTGGKLRYPSNLLPRVKTSPKDQAPDETGGSGLVGEEECRHTMEKHHSSIAKLNKS